MPRRSAQLTHKAMEKETGRDLSGSALSVMLDRAGLPRDYPRLSPRNKREERMRVLTSWFDPAAPHKLCGDVEAYLKALYIWVELYEKPAEINTGQYFFDDPTNKYDLVRMVMSPSLAPLDPYGNPSEPSMSIVTADRGWGKSITVVRQMVPMMAVTRPYTRILLSEANDELTKSEIRNIKEKIEGNELIQMDFGGPGVLYPRGKSSTWSTHNLHFLHHNGCEILGYSLNSAQRGRRPIFGVINDPEDDETSMNREWRVWFFNRLLGVYKPMYHFGGHIVWIGTPVDERSCLSLAMKGMSEKDGAAEEEPEEDQRFRYFRKGKFTAISRLPISDENPNGGWVSHQPQRLSVEAFLSKMDVDPITALKEHLCEPVTPGTRAFAYHDTDHEFMHCQGQDGGSEYMLDLYTGEEVPWTQWLKSLRVFGAGDLADGASPDSDFGALVIIGVDSRGTIYVLDCWLAQQMAEKQVETAYHLATVWDAEVLAWERVAMVCVINRFIKRYVDELRAKGETPPAFAEVDNARKNKVKRILTMTPLFGKYEIRFRCFVPLREEAEAEPRHRPAPYGRRGMYAEMQAQVKEYTDQGLRGHDDAVDALEMAVRIAGPARGQALAVDPADTVDVSLKRWSRAGVEITKEQLPMEAWTPAMQEEAMTMALSGGVIPYV